MNRLLPAALALLGLAACGGGSGAGVPGLVYQDPPGTQGRFALVLDPASTPSLLVLDLVGPEAAPACGVSFGFDLDPARANWSTSPVVSNGTLFTPAAGSQLVQGWVNGGRLQAVIANKGIADPVANLGPSQGLIGRIRLVPAPGAAAGPVSLADSGLATLLDRTGTATPVQVAVGSLRLQ